MTSNAPVGAAKFPVAAWLLPAGFAVLLITDFLPARITSISWAVFRDLVINAACVGLVWATFTRFRPRLWSLMTLIVLVAVECFGAIVSYIGAASPVVETLLSITSISFLAVAIIMARIAMFKGATA